MRDIKLKITKPSLKQKIEIPEAIKPLKSSISVLSIFSFGLMTFSLGCYIFFISTSIFYAVKTSQFEYKTEKLNTYSYSSIPKEISLNQYSDRISYISKDQETAITLK